MGDPAKLELARQLRGSNDPFGGAGSPGLEPGPPGAFGMAAQKPQHQQAHAARTAGSDTACDVITSLTDPVPPTIMLIAEEISPA